MCLILLYIVLVAYLSMFLICIDETTYNKEYIYSVVIYFVNTGILFYGQIDKS
jgi:hypothetical protein